MRLVILTPEKEVFQGEITSIKVPGTSGQFEVLKGHAAIVSSLIQGQVSVKLTKGQTKVYNIERGFIEVINDEISLLVRGLKEVA